LQDAARKIYNNEGGLAGFYTGVLQDSGKMIADSFLFFLTYSLLREKRVAARGSGKSLPAIDELGVGFVAGSFTKLLTAPIANIVTRKQAAALTVASLPDAEREGVHSKPPSSSQIAHDILQEKGILGFWSGYSASLVLTLNPSLTFFLFETLKRLLLPRSRRENPPASATFFLAAISKACASSVTYPFSLAKARAQAGMRREREDDKDIGGNLDEEANRAAARLTTFGTLLTVARTEGVRGMYEGLELEIVKSFFSHGCTMLAKQAIHRFLVQAYYVLSIVVARYKDKGANPVKLVERAKEQRVEYYDLAIARASERVADAKAALMAKANETAEFVAEYVEEGDETEWRNLYGSTGLARWLLEK
jgi:Mitochondrial carrier protein